MRTLDVRFDVLRNNVKLTELIQVGTPTVRMSSSSEIKTSLSGEFRPNDLFDIFADEIQPVIIINGVEHKCGVFAPATVSINETETGTIMSIEAYDRCWMVQSVRTETVRHFVAGTKYIDVIKNLLTEAGIALVIATASNLTLRYDREDWDIGTDYLTIVNTLLDEINYNQLWFDENGYAVLSPKKILYSAESSRTYDTHDPGCMILRSTSISMDLYDAPNVFICVCSNPDDRSTMRATAENNNPVSPLSIIRRGKRIARLYKVKNIASLSELEKQAQLLCQDNMMLGETISLTTAIMTGCGIRDVVAIVDDNAEGLWFETGWEIELVTGGTMSHTLEKAVKIS